MADESDEDIKLYNLVISRSAYPELWESLADLSGRDRAERLRSLAYIGLTLNRLLSSPDVLVDAGAAKAAPGTDKYQPEVEQSPDPVEEGRSGKGKNRQEHSKGQSLAVGPGAKDNTKEMDEKERKRKERARRLMGKAMPRENDRDPE